MATMNGTRKAADLLRAKQAPPVQVAGKVTPGASNPCRTGSSRTCLGAQMAARPPRQEYDQGDDEGRDDG